MRELAALYDRRGLRVWMGMPGPSAETTCNHGNSHGPADRSHLPGSD